MELTISGYGYGYGSGSGDGYGYGDDSGYGYGDGYDSGYGYGYGSGDGKKFLAAMLEQFQHTTGRLGLWRSSAGGTPSNGGDGEPVTVSAVQEIPGPLKLCTKNALHATLEPWKWKGERWWVVELIGEVQEDGDKMGALKRRIVADLGKCPFPEGGG